MDAPPKISITVIGGGPAGLAIVGNLLELKWQGSIVWIDRDFEGGCLNEYRQVPSISSNMDFVAYATTLEVFRSMIHRNNQELEAFSKLAVKVPKRNCPLGHVADLLLALTNAVAELDQIVMCKGRVLSVDMEQPTTSQWTVTVQLPHSGMTQRIETPKVVLCTGSVPMEISLPYWPDGIDNIDIATALDYSKLVFRLPLNEKHVVAVIGGSHSAVIVLDNLVGHAMTNNVQIQIKWFTRHALRYAEPTNGNIVHENNGLTCNTADYARAELEDNTLPTSISGQYITKVDLNAVPFDSMQAAAHLNECTHIVQATGFTRRGLDINIGGKPVHLLFNGDRGMLKYPNGNLVPGLYGAGAAYPRYVEKTRGEPGLKPADNMLGCMEQAQQAVPLWSV